MARFCSSVPIAATEATKPGLNPTSTRTRSGMTNRRDSLRRTDERLPPLHGPQLQMRTLRTVVCAQGWQLHHGEECVPLPEVHGRAGGHRVASLFLAIRRNGGESEQSPL